MSIKSKIFSWFPLSFKEDRPSSERYKILCRNMVIILVLVSMIPHFIMSMLDYGQHKKNMTEKIIRPLHSLLNKTKHPMELFLAERLSIANFIASSYSFQELANEKMLTRIFQVMKKEFKEFVDLGLIDSSGIQLSYVGPYKLQGKKYAEQHWFHEVQVRGTYISEVFMGYRKFPHIVIAVQHRNESGHSWVLRATIGMKKFNDIIASTEPDREMDVFLINHEGILQSPSKLYGKVLNKIQLSIPPVNYETNVIEEEDYLRRRIFLAYTYFAQSPFILVAVKPRTDIFKSWLAYRGNFLFYFSASILVIFFIAFWFTKQTVEEFRQCDIRREEAVQELEHSHKLSLIGRMAAGVAHEINNPMSIINEKAGLMNDIIGLNPDFPEGKKFRSLTMAILQSVKRCRDITHNLLGFSRRMEVQIEELDLNELLREVLGFLEKEALHRNIQIQLRLDENLPRIASDRGQLEQVFLNITNNAFEAVEKGGKVSIRTWKMDPDTVGVSIRDYGRGIREDKLKNIFDPFFTTTESGTGLGLSITFGIVKKFGGDISVKSKVGEGTTFIVYLPVKQKKGAGA